MHRESAKISEVSYEACLLRCFDHVIHAIRSIPTDCVRRDTGDSSRGNKIIKLMYGYVSRLSDASITLPLSFPIPILEAQSIHNAALINITKHRNLDSRVEIIDFIMSFRFLIRLCQNIP
jgi:hypothetical protein